MKNKAQTTFLSVIALGAVLILVMYMYYYKPTVENTNSLKATNANLQQRVTTLEEFYNEMPQRQQEINDMSASIKDSLSIYPADVLEEDVIYFAISSMKLDNLNELYRENVVPAADRIVSNFLVEEGDFVKYNSVGIGGEETIATIGGETVSAAAIEGMESALIFNKRLGTYQNETDYTSLKGLVQSINCDPEKKTLNSISYAVNEAGTLTGTYTLVFYSVEGTGKEYNPKDFGTYEVGLENLFIHSIEQ